ncbi:hypothetical protein BC835DRAFT_1354491 [Cytidiella melzeri]|nr:hypothetical protein BC835DRAFT_1354491 [Cytidiella melzeri]
MRISTSLVLFATVVTGAFHTVTVTATPYGRREPHSESIKGGLEINKELHLYSQLPVNAADVQHQPHQEAHSIRDNARATVLHSRWGPKDQALVNEIHEIMANTDEAKPPGPGASENEKIVYSGLYNEGQYYIKPAKTIPPKPEDSSLPKVSRM